MRALLFANALLLLAACGGSAPADVEVTAAQLTALAPGDTLVLDVKDGGAWYHFAGALDTRRIAIAFHDDRIPLTALGDRVSRVGEEGGFLTVERTPAVGKSGAALKQHVDNPGQTPMKDSP